MLLNNWKGFFPDSRRCHLEMMTSGRREQLFCLTPQLNMSSRVTSLVDISPIGTHFFSCPTVDAAQQPERLLPGFKALPSWNEDFRLERTDFLSYTATQHVKQGDQIEQYFTNWDTFFPGQLLMLLNNRKGFFQNSRCCRAEMMTSGWREQLFCFIPQPRNTEGGSITVLLTSCLTGLN